MSSAQAIPVRGIHHLELWVGNARQAAHYYRKAFGFSQVAYAGPETGCRDHASYVLEQQQIRLVLSTPLSDEGPMAEHICRHGDGVRDVAFLVDDADAAFQLATSRGAQAASLPADIGGDGARGASIHAYGDTVHSFIDRRGYSGPFLPGYAEARIEEPGAELHRVDHVVANVEEGKMETWADWYAQIFGFTRYMSFDDTDISTEFSALRSIVMTDPAGMIKLPINEPAAGRKRSQIQEYLDFYKGPGVQHVALSTEDALSSVRELACRGLAFLEVPSTYYDALPQRIGRIDEPLAAVRQSRLLVDRDEEGYLLQIFTRPVEDRPTLFFEIIQRKGARGFGKGNFRALFEAIEREQARRGNL